MSLPANIVPLDYRDQLLEGILGQLDIKISQLRNAIVGSGNVSLTDIKSTLENRLPRVLYDSNGNELSGYIKNLDTTLSSRASESTLAGIKSQTDKLRFDGNSYLYVNAAVVANPPNLDVALSTRASESTLSGIKSKTDKLTFDSNNYLYVNAAVVANPSNLDVALSTRASESTLSSFSAKFPSATSLSDSLSNPSTTIVGSALLGWDGSYWRRVAVDSSSRLRTVVESLPSLPSGSNIIGGVFADFAVGVSINQTVDTTEVVGAEVNVTRRGRKVVYMKNTQDVDVTITIEGSYDGTDWYTIRGGIVVPAGGVKVGILTDAHGYLRARAVASGSPSTGSVLVVVASMT